MAAGQLMDGPPNRLRGEKPPNTDRKCRDEPRERYRSLAKERYIVEGSVGGAVLEAGVDSWPKVPITCMHLERHHRGIIDCRRVRNVATSEAGRERPTDAREARVGSRGLGYVEKTNKGLVAYLVERDFERVAGVGDPRQRSKDRRQNSPYGD